MNEYTRHKECELMQVRLHQMRIHSPQGIGTYIGEVALEAITLATRNSNLCKRGNIGCE